MASERERQTGNELDARDTSWFTDILLYQQSDYLSAAPRKPKQRRAARPISRAINFVALAATGFILAAAANLVAETRPALEETRRELLDRVNSLQQRGSELEVENRRLRTRNAQLERFVLPDIDNQLAQQLAVARKSGGFAELEGRGLLVELANPENSDEYSEVYDIDLQVVVNALFAAGAEGVMVDGIRVGAGTSIREAGGTILVDYKPVTSPYRVLAVGDGLLAKLRKSVFQSWLSDLQDTYQISVVYRERALVKLPAGRIPAVEYAEEVGQ